MCWQRNPASLYKSNTCTWVISPAPPSFPLRRPSAQVLFTSTKYFHISAWFFNAYSKDPWLLDFVSLLQTTITTSPNMPQAKNMVPSSPYVPSLICLLRLSSSIHFVLFWDRVSYSRQASNLNVAKDDFGLLSSYLHLSSVPNRCLIGSCSFRIKPRASAS